MAKSSPRAAAAPPTSLLIATRKGLWIMAGDARRTSWKLQGPHFLGHIVHHAVLDPRDGKTLLVAARTGHLGHTVMRSTNRGRTWTESKQPPVFDPAHDARSVDHVFWLSPGHATEPGVWYAGTSPRPVPATTAASRGRASAALTTIKRKDCGGDKDGTPDGPKVHSVIVDPRDANHLYISMSGGGTFESTDRGAGWKPLNKGVLATFYPDPYPEYGQDPHCVRMHPAQPDRLYQQNHCGIFRLDRPSDTWVDIGKGMPKKVGNIGFPMTCIRAIRHGVGVPDGRLRRLAAHVARRQARRVPDHQRRQDLAAPGQGVAGRAGVVDRQAAGDDHRRARGAGPLFRDHQRRDLGEQERGRVMEVPGQPSAACVCGHRLRVALAQAPAAAMRVLI
jgi:hypothetical protein